VLAGLDGGCVADLVGHHTPAMQSARRASGGLDIRGGWSGDCQPPHHTARRNLSPARGAIMTVTPDPTTLPAVADRADIVATGLRRLATSDGPPSARDLVDLAAEAAALTLTLLEAALPSVDNDEPGTEEPFERAAELGDDARRHLVSAFHLLAGAHGVVAARPQTT
jgi:hypothetical protein